MTWRVGSRGPCPGMPYEDLRLISIHIYAFSLSVSPLCCLEVENEKETPFPLVFSIDRKCGHTQEKKLFRHPLCFVVMTRIPPRFKQFLGLLQPAER